MVSKKLASFGTSIFTKMFELAQKHDAVNLSQGFPNFEGPKELKEELIREVNSGWNQYVSSIGIYELREKLAEYYANEYSLLYSPEKEITVTQGATEALFNTIVGLVDSGDEVIVFEPFYDSYHPNISVAGGIPIPVTVSIEKELIEADLLSVVSKKTKFILMNTPQNPTGKIFSKKEIGKMQKRAAKKKG